MVMPNQPNDRYQQDAERSWEAVSGAAQLPAQPRYREARADTPLSWAQLDALPAGAATLRGLNTH
jgi:hypothetical protein